MARAGLAQQRIAAWLIDFVLVLGIGALVSGLGWLAGTGYWLIRDGLFEGQSIGKRLMGLTVVIGPGRSRCTFQVSALRNLLWIIPIVNLLMGLTGLWILLTDSAGRHWGDRLADTRVVKL